MMHFPRTNPASTWAGMAEALDPSGVKKIVEEAPLERNGAPFGASALVVEARSGTPELGIGGTFPTIVFAIEVWVDTIL